EPAGSIEDSLAFAQPVRQRGQQGRVDLGPSRKRGKVERQALDGGGAADAAGRAAEEAPAGTRSGTGLQVDVNLVRLHEVRLDPDRGWRVLTGLGADAHVFDLGEIGEHALGPEQPEGELEVVAWRPHHDAERFADLSQVE